MRDISETEGWLIFVGIIAVTILGVTFMYHVSSIMSPAPTPEYLALKLKLDHCQAIMDKDKEFECYKTVLDNLNKWTE